MKKGVATIARKVLQQLGKCKHWRKVWAYSPDTDEYVVVGTVAELRELADAVTAKPVHATARPKKAGRVGR